MTWHDIVRNPEPVLPQLRRRFPELRRRDLIAGGGDMTRVVRRLASSHDLTPREARLELEDALFAADLRQRRSRRT